ncbi:VC0807 family protein [Marinobacter qingdaonensis]|jgi:intracellular septation protein A|uniref:VC0807 family protein n=1 Tax=Marinobacter qingdaonensis TaxID=3108486 RepID=A0ABU5NWM7_9GAMM|nr:VC0807 family protein [Marinobacter sp. ASW11-75]MEA1080201.1 VC0807 family protein [Marinobacter sp. ASW11-75]MEE2763045.1 VC0807 family protein [Pseudomonadota bacterium]
MTAPTTPSHPDHKPRPWIDLLVSIVIPSVILMKFSGDEHLGSVNALIIGLAFPLGWGLFELIRYRKKNFIAVLGLISVGLTGGIGLLELDAGWLAVKEAAVPAVIGLAVLISTRTRYPLVRTLLYNPNVLDVDKIHRSLEKQGRVEEFEARLLNASYFFAGTFLFSSIMNYIIARWIVTSPSGTQAFNEELGRMTLVSYPMIAIPSMVMMLLIFYYLWRTIRRLTGYTLEEVMAPHLAEKEKKKSMSQE